MPKKRTLPHNATLIDRFGGFELHSFFVSADTAQFFVTNEKGIVVQCVEIQAGTVDNQACITHLTALNATIPVPSPPADANFAKWEAQLIQHKISLGAERDNLRDTITNMEDLASHCDEAYDNVDRAIDALSELV